MEDELHNKAEKAAKDAGQTLAEWVRRAMKEKLEREEQETSFVTRAEFEELQNRITSMEKNSQRVSSAYDSGRAYCVAEPKITKRQ
jgi:hypothetical protein